MFGDVARTERWPRIGGLIGHWFPRVSKSAGVPASELASAEQRLGVTLPAALREWYEQYGGRDDVWSHQDRLLAPYQLKIDRETLVFYVENQDVVQWGVRLHDLASADPPVVVSDPKGTNAWLVESETTTEFAAQLTLMNAKWSAPCGANGSGNADTLAAIVRTYPRIPVGDMHWASWPTRFYGTNDVLIETNGDTWIWASALSPAALAEVDTLMRAAGMDDWEHYQA